MSRSNLTNILLALFTLAQGFFLGILFGGVVPLVWPYNVVIGYVAGLLVAGFIAFELLKKWPTRARTKIMTAIIILVVTGAVATQLQLIILELAKIHLSLMAQ